MNENVWLWLVAGIVVGAFIIWLLIGGKLKVTKEGLEVETEGLLRYLREAAAQKGTANPDEAAVRKEIKTRVITGKLPTLQVLWVDDHPISNLYERLALAAAGVFIDSYTNNGDAISVLNAAGFELVISDLGRTAGTETGWDLLDGVRKLRPEMPFIFYVSHIDDVIRRRAQELRAEVTNDPARLAQFVIAHIPETAPRAA